MAAWLYKPEGSTAAEAEIRQFWPRQQKHSVLPFSSRSLLWLAQGGGKGWPFPEPR